MAQSVQSDPASKHSDLESDHHTDPHSEDHSEQSKRVCSNAKKHSDKEKPKVWAKCYSRSSSSEEDQSSVKKSTKPQQKAPDEPEHQQDSTDPVFYREVDMSGLTSQYAEEVETFRQILELPDPRETLPRSSTTVLGLDDEKGQQGLRPRGPSAMLPLNSILKDAFEKFEQDFLASNLPEGKYIKPPASSAKYYKVGQPCFEDKIQELNTDFAKICISPKPSGAPMGKVPVQVLKELEHKARQNLSTINFTANFAKNASSCNTVMEKCQHSIKTTFNSVKSQIQKGADPERAVRRGYENACDYFEIMNQRILIQQRALACLSKSVAYILQRELYTMGNTGLPRREAEMTLLQPHLGDSRRQELRNSPFCPMPLFRSQSRMEKTSTLTKAPLKTLRVLDPIKTSLFVVPTGNAPMGAIPPKAIINRFPQVGGNRTEASEVVFDPTDSDEGMENPPPPPPNDSLQASLSPPVGGRLRSFRRDWLTNKCSDVLNITNGYVLPFSKPNLVRAHLIRSGYKAVQKDQALASCISSLFCQRTQ